MKEKQMLRVIVMFTVWTVSVTLQAADIPARQKLTMDQAVQTALTHSPYLKAVEHQRNADQTYKQEARGWRLPSVDLQEIYIRTNSPMDVFGLQLSQESFSMADFAMNDVNHPSPIDDYVTQLQVSQPLYMGGKITNGIRAGENMARAADRKLDRARQDVMYQTRTAYLNALLASRYAALMDEVVKTVSAHVDTAQAYFETGFIMEADLLQARVVLSDMEQKQITAHNRANLARAFLNNVMGVDQNESFQLVDDIRFEPVSIDLDHATAIALESRPDLQELSYKIEAARNQVNVERAEYKPKVFLVGQINYHDNTFGGTDGDSFKLMAVARFNLFNGKRTKARVRRAESQVSSYEKFLEQMKEGIQLQVRQAVLNVKEAEARYKVADLALQQAEKNRALREARFEKGVEKMTDLMDADTAWQQAATVRLHALFDWFKAKEALSYAMGKTE